MEKIKVAVEKMYPDVDIPTYQTGGSAGCDIKAYLPKDKYPSGEFVVEYGETKTVPTGLKFSVPDGYEMQIRPRSGLSLKTKIRIANSPGTLDSDYRGELMIIVDNVTAVSPGSGYSIFGFSPDSIVIKHGDRIAQIVIAPVVMAQFEVKEKLDETERGDGGFGSTGTK